MSNTANNTFAEIIAADKANRTNKANAKNKRTRSAHKGQLIAVRAVFMARAFIGSAIGAVVISAIVVFATN